jgi:mannosidase alpha-like ER degradation enhancer 2
MPYGTVNLRYGVNHLETPVTCTAGVGTFLLEFGTLSRLTGNPHYERAALKALKALWESRSALGLVGNHINVQTGVWTATDAGIGAGVDSYFEYLVKSALLFQRPMLMHQFYEYEAAINRYVRKDDWFMWVSMTKGQVSLPIFQSLEAFWPGLLVQRTPYP